MKTFLYHPHLFICRHHFPSLPHCQSESILHLNAIESSWQFRVLALTQLSWELRTVYTVSLVHMDTGKFTACLGWQTVFEDCKNCALLGSLAPRRGLPACPWSVSSAGLCLSQTPLMREFLGFSLGEPSLHPPDFLESSLPMLKVPGALRIGSRCLSKGSQNSLDIIYLWLQFVKKGTRVFQPINCQRNTYLR